MKHNVENLRNILHSSFNKTGHYGTQGENLINILHVRSLQHANDGMKGKKRILC